MDGQSEERELGDQRDAYCGRPAAVIIQVPQWAAAVSKKASRYLAVEERMDLVLDLADRNILDGGGPFAAALFGEDGRVVAVGIDRVIPDSVPIAHAEIVAIAAAGQSLGSWDLASVGSFELVTSTEPCAMCLGAVSCSGVSSLVIGARAQDAKDAGCEDGVQPKNWMSDLSEAGIVLHRDVRRADAAELLFNYREEARSKYSGRSATVVPRVRAASKDRR